MSCFSLSWCQCFSPSPHRIKYTDDNKTEKRMQNVTTELRCPPVGRLPSCMGTLSRELRQCAADTEVVCTVGAAAHVLHTGLDVWFRVYQVGAGAPGLWTQHLVTDGLLTGKEKTKLLCCKCYLTKITIYLFFSNHSTLRTIFVVSLSFNLIIFF